MSNPSNAIRLRLSALLLLAQLVAAMAPWWTSPAAHARNAPPGTVAICTAAGIRFVSATDALLELADRQSPSGESSEGCPCCLLPTTAAASKADRRFASPLATALAIITPESPPARQRAALWRMSRSRPPPVFV